MIELISLFSAMLHGCSTFFVLILLFLLKKLEGSEYVIDNGRICKLLMYRKETDGS